METRDKPTGTGPKFNREAAASPPGVIALLVLSLSAFGIVLFKDVSEIGRIIGFISLTGSIGFFGFLVFRKSPGAPTDSDAGDIVGDDAGGEDVIHGDRIDIQKPVAPAFGKSAQELVYSRHQLREPSDDFVGRREKLERIKQALRRGGAAVIAGLEGIGGIGKTETGLVAANELIAEGRFPDAQIFIDLHGFTPGSAPRTTVEALSQLLRPLVPPDALLPEVEEELARLWHDATADLDMLVFLDNALDEAQLRPLLPRHSGCATIITSRNRLSLDGLSAVELGIMKKIEAIEFASALANRRDAGRLTDEQSEKLADLCGCLPMAIEVAANTLASATGWKTAEFLNALSDRSWAFDKGQPGERNLKATLAVGLETLDGVTRARWQTLGLFEDGFDASAVDLLWEVDDAQPMLAKLEARSLVSFDRDANRHHLHDLLRGLAQEELSQDTEREANVRHRHAVIYLDVLQAANGLFDRGHDAVAAGLALLDRELANIRAGQRWSASRADETIDDAGLAMRYPHFDCLRLRLSPDEYIGWLEAALAAALKLRNREAEAAGRGNLGNLYRTSGDLDAAEEMYRGCLGIHDELGRWEDMAVDYVNLANLYRTSGKLDAAEDMYRKSLAIHDQLGRRDDMAGDYINLANLYRTSGKLDAAEEMYRECLAIEEELGLRDDMAGDYGNLGNLYSTKGDLDAAEEMYRKSLAIHEELGHREGMASNYGNLGILYNTRGDLDAAGEMYRKSLAIHEDLGHREGMARAYGNLGVLYFTRGDLDAAEEMYRKSLAIEEALGRTEGMASDYGNLGNLYCARGDLDAAEEMYRKSLAIEEESGHTEGMASDYGNLGNLYRTRGDLDAAGEMFRKSLALFHELGAVDQILHVEASLLQLDELRKQT